MCNTIKRSESRATLMGIGCVYILYMVIYFGGTKDMQIGFYEINFLALLTLLPALLIEFSFRSRVGIFIKVMAYFVIYFSVLFVLYDTGAELLARDVIIYSVLFTVISSMVPHIFRMTYYD